MGDPGSQTWAENPVMLGKGGWRYADRGTGALPDLTEHEGALGRLGVLWTALLVVGLILATVVDGDGNPKTENLPLAALTLAPRTVRSADDHTTDDDEHECSIALGSRLLQPRLKHPFFRRELRWRRLAIPSRGPPAEGSDGRA